MHPMVELTGVLATILLFVAGPYRTLQKRLPRRWGPVLSVWAHGNVSLAAATAVFVHVLILTDGGFEGLSRALLSGSGVTWVATLLFTMSVATGVAALYMTSAPRSRQRWLDGHRRLTFIFYLAIIPHVFTQGVLRWPVVLLAASAWGIVAGRSRLRVALARPDWPRIGRWKDASATPTPSRLLSAASSSAAFLVPLAIAGLTFAAFRTGSGPGIELTGRIAEVRDGSFSLESSAGTVRVRISAQTEMDARSDLRQLQRQGAVVSVDGARGPDGTVLATEIELD